jgi:hypothetical protein
VRRSDKRGARPDAASATATNGKSTAAAPKARKSTAKPRAKAQPRTTSTAKATARAARPVGAASAAEAAGATSTGPRRTIPPAGYASPTSHADADQPSASADLIGTALQAAGELAQIGFAVGRQALQSMIDRLPKP